MTDFIKVATTDEVPVGGRKIFDVDDVTVALFNIHLDPDGRVKTTSQSMDLRNQGG